MPAGTICRLLPPPAPPDRANHLSRTAHRVLLLLASLLVALVLAEAAVRGLPGRGDAGPEGPPPRNFITTLDGVELTPEVVFELGLMEKLEPAPRVRLVFKPGTKVRMCYTGPRQPYFDEDGCIPIEFNACSLREREEVCLPKPAGGKRILCLGDSFTFGWGVRVEDAWPRLVEQRLRARAGDHVRTVNCGAAGTLYVDEYALALFERFSALEPDAVLVSLCLNDLLNINGGLHHTGPPRPRPEPPTWVPRLLVRLREHFSPPRQPARMNLDPSRDWTTVLLEMPADHERYRGTPGRDVLWAGGGVQAALLAMRDWCDERGLPFLVALWPLFQGLDDDELYPFGTMHRLVAEFCAQHEIPFLDLLPVFRGQPTTSLWVSPGDQHGNPRAQRLAAPHIAEFVAEFVEL